MTRTLKGTTRILGDSTEVSIFFMIERCGCHLTNIVCETIESAAFVQPGSLAVGEAMLSDAMNKTLFE